MAFKCIEVGCEHCTKGYKFVSGLYRHYVQKHPRSPRCADLCDEVNRTAWAKTHKPATQTNTQPKPQTVNVQVEGLSYRQFMSVKTTELKATITDSRERMRVIGRLWQESKAQPSTASVDTLEALLNMLCPNRDTIASPEPNSLPIPSWVLSVETVEVEEEVGSDDEVAEVVEEEDVSEEEQIEFMWQMLVDITEDEEVEEVEVVEGSDDEVAEVDEDEILEEVAEKVMLLASHADLQDCAYNCITIDLGFNCPNLEAFGCAMHDWRKRVCPKVRDYSKGEIGDMWNAYIEAVKSCGLR